MVWRSWRQQISTQISLSVPLLPSDLRSGWYCKSFIKPSRRLIGGFHVTSSPPCWWTVNKRLLICLLCLSTSICSFHHCYLWLLRLHENHLLFQTYLRGGVGLFVSGGLFNLANTMVSVLHKELEYKVENLSESWRSCSGGSKTNPNFQLVNNTSQISPHELLQSWLVNTFNHLLVKNNNGEGRGLKREGVY